MLKVFRRNGNGRVNDDLTLTITQFFKLKVQYMYSNGIRASAIFK